MNSKSLLVDGILLNLTFTFLYFEARFGSSRGSLLVLGLHPVWTFDLPFGHGHLFYIFIINAMLCIIWLLWVEFIWYGIVTDLAMPYLAPTPHPLTSSLDKWGSLFTGLHLWWTAFCCFRYPPWEMWGQKPPSPSFFHSFLPFLAPLSTPLKNCALYDIICLSTTCWKKDAADADFTHLAFCFSGGS